MRPVRIPVSIALLLLLAGSGRPADTAEIPAAPSETVVVTASLSAETLGRVNREVLVLEGEELRQLPVRTVDDLLAFLPPVDVRPRVPGGLFGDVSLRAAGESGVLICIDGLRWNDPQTGHFNLEIPVPIELIERVEVLSGCQSIFYGSDAVGGVINIITRRELPPQAGLHLSGGSFGTAGLAALGAGRVGRVRGHAFGSWSRSDGFAANRDYRIGEGLAGLEIAHGLGRTGITYAHLDNRFGAQGFYGPYPSYEETLTDALWSLTTLDLGFFRKIPTDVRFAVKQHDDDFILVRDHPELYRNHHVTRASLLQAVSRLYDNGRTRVAASAEVTHGRIESDRLSNHAYTRWGAAAEIQQELRPGLQLQGSLRLDHDSDWGARWTPGAGISCFLRPSVKLRGFCGQAFRAPTFTELYYQSPGNIGNPGLLPEESTTVEGGADWYPHPGLTVSFTLFRRWDRNLIDWIRDTPADPWRAVNIGTVDATGTSIQAAGTLPGQVRLQGGWSWNHLDPGEVEYQSKYALDYARHHVSALATVPFGRGTRLSAALQYKVRADGRSYVPASLEVLQGWRQLEFYARVDNLFDQDYEEIPGVAMPGRFFSGGIRLRHVFE